MSFIGATGLDEVQEQFDTLNDKIDANADYINNLVGIPDPTHTAVFGINILNPGLFGLVERAEVNIAALQTGEEGLTTDITGLTTQVEGIETQITGIQGEISTIQGEITGIEGEISTIQGEILVMGLAITAAAGTAGDALIKANKSLGIWDEDGNNTYNMKSGNVAIGILPKGTILNNKLEVNGSINIPTNSKYKINNVPLSYSDLAGTPPVSSKWTNATDVATNIYYSTGNVGIGVTSAINNKLEVGGSINIPTGSKYKINNIDLSYNDLTNKLTGGTNISIVSGAINNTYTYTLPTAGVGAGGNLGGVKVDGTSITITNGIISSTSTASGASISLDGSTNNRSYGWTGSTSLLGRVGVAETYAIGSLVEDVVLRSQGRLLLQSGTNNPALTIETTTNNILVRNSIGIGTTTISSGSLIDVGGFFKVAFNATTDALTLTSTGVQVNNTLNVSSGVDNGGKIRFGGFSDDSSFDLATIQNRIYAPNKSELLLFKGDNIEGSWGADRIRLRAGAIAFDTFSTELTTSATNENIRMYIAGNGNVGIGSTIPNYKLEVNGVVNATEYRVNGGSLNLNLSQGMSVQTKHLTYTQMDVKNNTGWEPINDDLSTGFVIAITPTNTASKVLLNMIAHIGNVYTGDFRWWGLKLYRKIGTGAWTEITGANGSETGAAANTNGTPVWVSHNTGMSDSFYDYTIQNVTGTYLDAPNTTSIVYYTIYWNSRVGDASNPANSMYINRTNLHGDAYRAAPSSSLTATEIWDLGTPYTPPTGSGSVISILGNNVGIGTNSPSSLLHLHTTANDTQVRLQLTDGTTTSGINSGLAIYKGSDQNGYLWNYQNNSLIFGTNSLERARISAGGNVGIGTNNPNDFLHLHKNTANTDVSFTLTDLTTGSAFGNGFRIRKMTTEDVEIVNGHNKDLIFGANNTNFMRIKDYGAVGIQTNGYAIPNNFMWGGSLTIGNVVNNYGGGTTGWNTSTAGLLMECLDSTEIAVHDSGNSIHSFMRYTTNGNFTIGRNMGYGVANVSLDGALSVANYVLSNSRVYSRGGGFDTWLYSDSIGMSLNMGLQSTEGAPTYFKMGAYNGQTFFESNQQRSFIFKIYVGVFSGTAPTWSFNSSFNCFNANNSTSWNQASDQRIKENIVKADLKTCYDNIKNINLYRYKFIDAFDNGFRDKNKLGYVAQEVRKHFPKATHREKKRLNDNREIPDLLSIDVEQINLSLYGAVKQLIKVVEKQSKRIKALETLLNIEDNDDVEDDAGQPYERIYDENEIDIDTIEPTEPSNEV